MDDFDTQRVRWLGSMSGSDKLDAAQIALLARRANEKATAVSDGLPGKPLVRSVEPGSNSYRAVIDIDPAGISDTTLRALSTSLGVAFETDAADAPRKLVVHITNPHLVRRRPLCGLLLDVVLVCAGAGLMARTMWW